MRELPITGATGVVGFARVDEADWDRTYPLAWNLHRSRDGVYVRSTKVDGRRHMLHRFVLGLANDDPRQVDHIDGDPLNCQRANLRVCTDALNAQNQGSRGGSSRYRGVTWDRARGKWMASATLNGRRTTIGRFDTEQEANAAAVAWRARHMPFSEDARVA